MQLTTDSQLCLALLGNASSLAHLVAQVVKLGATNTTVANDLELTDLGAVQRESTLDTNAEGDLADGEGLASTGTAHADNVALEDLDALAIAFLNAVMHLDVVADVDIAEDDRAGANHDVVA